MGYGGLYHRPLHFDSRTSICRRVCLPHDSETRVRGAARPRPLPPLVAVAPPLVVVAVKFSLVWPWVFVKRSWPAAPLAFLWHLSMPRFPVFFASSGFGFFPARPFPPFLFASSPAVLRRRLSWPAQASLYFCLSWVPRRVAVSPTPSGLFVAIQ